MSVINTPINEPARTSIKKCCDKYIRENPTIRASINNISLIYLFLIITTSTKTTQNIDIV